MHPGPQFRSTAVPYNKKIAHDKAARAEANTEDGGRSSDCDREGKEDDSFSVMRDLGDTRMQLVDDGSDADRLIKWQSW